jgi:hypothetical protein
MRNHYHLLVEAELDDLSTGMRVLNGSYAKTFNKRHGRTGHLFGERFWCEAIEREEHLLECIRYIANNPVRAGFCAEPGSWPWGSYRALAGLDRMPTFLAADATLSLFGDEPRRSRQRFTAFVAER